jgi:hypothetical protein
MDWFSWLLSATSVLMLWMMGNKSNWGPIIGIMNQFLWFYYILFVLHGQYGLIIGTIAFTVVHIRNLILWKRSLNGNYSK